MHQWPEREWAVEGSLGVGRPLAQRLLEAGERVVDVPAKLAARARLLDTGHGRKTDAHDAHSVAVAAVRAKDLRVLAPDGQLEALRMLVDHRDQLSSRRVQTVNRLHRLLAELAPGKTKKDLTALQAKALLASARPRDVAGKTRRQLAADELADLITIEKKVKALTIEIKAIVKERGSHLMDLSGVGPVVAARILADVGDVARFADRNRFASWTGTAPLDASSGEQTRHRLSRAGNRRMNRMLHIAATTQIRLDTEGRAYYRRKLADGKTRMEAMRCCRASDRVDGPWRPTSPNDIDPRAIQRGNRRSGWMPRRTVARRQSLNTAVRWGSLHPSTACVTSVARAVLFRCGPRRSPWERTGPRPA
ncbi:MAG: IS110 family transposase, partial [Actinomycetes bacterium]